MLETLTITTERVDDIPLLLAQLRRMDVPRLIDSYFPPHGNWQGLTPGWVTVIWLTHILAQANHRLSHVQRWVTTHLQTLQAASGQVLTPLDFTDDRLASLLHAFSDDRWPLAEAALTRQILRVYAVPTERVRLDTTTTSGYWQITDEGLFQLGHSKDHRPDLPQVKILLASLDPLGLPLVTEVVAGHRADDPLYIPAITRCRATLGQRGLLYVGDTKMAALATRAHVQSGGDYYLCPLAATQCPPATRAAYLAPVLAGDQPLTPITRLRADGPSVLIAEGYERSVPLTAPVDGRVYTWEERHLIVRSLATAAAGRTRLDARLTAAQAALTALNTRGRGQKRLADRAAVDGAITAITAHHQVTGLLVAVCQETVSTREVRGYKGQPGRTVRTWDYQVCSTIAAQPLEQARALLGWQVYATNQPAATMRLEAAVRAYRDEYLIEDDFGRLKGAPLSIRPLYLQRADHVVGLGRLLGIGLRVLTLVEFVVRRALATTGSTLAGLTKGQPQAKTARPTTERLLEQFEGVTLTRVSAGPEIQYHLTPLTSLQQQILALLELPATIYTQLPQYLAQPP
ncbi:MAG: transposase [Chloroflexota bacterium]|nr:transposase [Chloroflexota bacterium]